MHVEPHQTPQELQQQERGEKNVTRSKRLRVLILALEGWTDLAVATAVGLSRRACQDWVRRYNEQGLAALEERRGRPRQAALDSEEEAALRVRIEAGPTEADAVCTLRGKDFQRVLAAEFGLWRSLTGVYRLLHQLGYSCLRPRPRYPQERFRGAPRLQGGLARANREDRP